MAFKSTMDLAPLIFDGDRQTREQLMADPDFAAAAAELAQAEPCVSARRLLLANALKLTPVIAPEAFRALRRARKRLQVKGRVELYCVPQPQLNAFVTLSTKGTVLIALSSAALEALDTKELTFVMGHELGHVLFDHLALHPSGFAQYATIAPLHMARLYAWMRYAELSADRVGLYCCGDYDVAVRQSFKMTSGLTEERFLANAAECAEQYAELEAEELGASEEDWFSTHPYSPLRLRALDLFSRSHTFHKMFDSDDGELDDATLEREVAALMGLMNPTFLDDGDAALDDVRAFLALAGRRVALADGRVTADEEQVIERLMAIAGPPPKQKAIRLLTDDEMTDRLITLGDKLRLGLSYQRKHKLLEDLLAVAMADNLLHEAEVDTLVDIAQLLEADRMAIDTTMRRLEVALD